MSDRHPDDEDVLRQAANEARERVSSHFEEIGRAAALLGSLDL